MKCFLKKHHNVFRFDGLCSPCLQRVLLIKLKGDLQPSRWVPFPPASSACDRYSRCPLRVTRSCLPACHGALGTSIIWAFLHILWAGTMSQPNLIKGKVPVWTRYVCVTGKVPQRDLMPQDISGPQSGLCLFLCSVLVLYSFQLRQCMMLVLKLLMCREYKASHECNFEDHLETLIWGWKTECEGFVKWQKLAKKFEMPQSSWRRWYIAWGRLGNCDR